MRGPRRSPHHRSSLRTIGIASIVACATTLAGCSTRVFSPYQMEVQQGNFVTQKEVGLLREGMTREQVRFVMGTPLVADLFRVDRWDYVYTRQPENSDRSEKRRVTVHFDGDVVKRLEDVNVPPATETRPGQTAASR